MTRSVWDPQGPCEPSFRRSTGSPKACFSDFNFCNFTFGQRGACIRCILYTAVVMYTSKSPPLPALSGVYVYVLYTYTKICHHACPLYAFYTAEIHQIFERFQAGVTVNMTKKAYYGGHMLSRSVSAPYPTIYSNYSVHTAPTTPSK